ncbi:MAG TPA: helix-turn-helix domain-containing protein [Actinophytocola sp.]|uniref:helix-turn-helix domain-containing protein n=1 Tax=Actinophytocola sp. TaxID=1872138 RepID=UPI002DBCD038|nr:helix-turn-helix domain-containing protein [Actinophytocola sp.]HEU5469769.1 helix-turn-helix domain-containing protein [Actinophytocola sp.]
MTAVVAGSDAVRQLLDLLATEASGERLARARELALRIENTLAAHRRREAHLTALFETASDLTRLHDPDEVLRSIVHRARMLLGADVSYLTLNDEPAGKTYMRVTEGSVSALFQQVRLGMGEGLGGLVAQTARPYATAGYMSDARFHHTGPIDAAVREEGLVAILGVPLALAEKVIGVLYAADRAPREWAAEEVALLSSLANHAAVALDNARLLDEISAHNAALRRAASAHDRLADLVLRGGDIPEVAAAVADVLHGGIIVFDASDTELARIGAEPMPPPVAAIAAARSSGRSVSTSDGWVCAVLAGPELLGSLVLTGRPALTDADRRLFERASVVTALLFLLRRSVAQAEEQVRGELLADLLTTPDRNPAALLARARRLGIDLAAAHTVLVAHTDGVSRRRLAMACARYAALVGVHAERVVLLSPDPSPGPLAGKLAAELSSTLDTAVTVGASGPAAGPVAIAGAHDEASRCLRALLSLGRHGHGAALSELGFVGQLLGNRTNLADYIRATLGPVLDYDARRGTELVHTLRTYFECGGNLTRAKDVLHVHVNTVVQRLDRVAALLGDDWQRPDRALEIQLALRLHSLS